MIPHTLSLKGAVVALGLAKTGIALGVGSYFAIAPAAVDSRRRLLDHLYASSCFDLENDDVTLAEHRRDLDDLSALRFNVVDGWRTSKDISALSRCIGRYANTKAKRGVEKVEDFFSDCVKGVDACLDGLEGNKAV